MAVTVVNPEAVEADSPPDFDKVNNASLGGYRLTKVKNGRIEPTFEAILAKDGKPVLAVTNDGRGGCDMYRPLPDTPYRDVLEALLAHAQKWSIESGTPMTPGEPDMFIGHLSTCFDISRRKQVVVVMPGMNPFSYLDGRFSIAPSGATRNDVFAHYSGRGMLVHIWDKENWRFEAVS